MMMQHDGGGTMMSMHHHYCDAIDGPIMVVELLAHSNLCDHIGILAFVYNIRYRLASARVNEQCVIYIMRLQK